MDEQHSDEFVALSGDSWPQWEKAFGTRLYGLWRSLDTRNQQCRLFLCCRYPDLEAWERSRFWNAKSEGPAQDSLDKFRRRREITTDTWLSIMRLL